MKPLTDAEFIALVGEFATRGWPPDAKRGLLAATTLRELHAGQMKRELLAGEVDLHDDEDVTVRGLTGLMVYEGTLVYLTENVHELPRQRIALTSLALANAMDVATEVDETLRQKVRGTGETHTVVMCVWLTNAAGAASVVLYRRPSLTDKEAKSCFKIFVQDVWEAAQAEHTPAAAQA